MNSPFTIPTAPNMSINQGTQNPYGGAVDPSIFNPDAASVGNSTAFYRNLIQQGKIDPNAAFKSLYSDYESAARKQGEESGAGGYAILGSTVSGLKGSLFQPMYVKNTMGRTGLLNPDGSISLQGAQINKSVTTGAGSTGTSNFTPVTPYDPATEGMAPKINIPSVPKFNTPQSPQYRL